jgi:hypothetical protein
MINLVFTRLGRLQTKLVMPAANAKTMAPYHKMCAPKGVVKRFIEVEGGKKEVSVPHYYDRTIESSSWHPAGTQTSLPRTLTAAVCVLPHKEKVFKGRVVFISQLLPIV